MAPADDSSKTRIAGGDAGQGAHKPSEKHALDDVLKSLQDLIRNELLEDQRPPAPSAPPPDPNVPRKRGRPRKPPPPEPPVSETPPRAPEPRAEMDTVMSALEYLVEHELNPDDAAAGANEHVVADRLTDNQAAPANEPTGGQPAPGTTQAGTDSGKRRGDQHEFSFDLDQTAAPPPPAGEPGLAIHETVLEPPPPDDTPAEFSITEPSNDITPASIEADATQTVPEVLPEPSAGDQLPPGDLVEEISIASPPDDTGGDSAAPPEMSMEGAFIEEHPAETDSAETFAHELAFDDIPVLQDVVSPPPPGSHSGSADAPAIDPQKLRDLSVRVVARLNIELRKRGESPLDARLIDRLQGLLRDEWEKSSKGGK
jgi:hypothetical protein